MGSKDSIRLLTISDIHGNLDSFSALYDGRTHNGEEIDFIVHTGSFGFWNKETVESHKDINYLKQIVAFSDVLENEVVEELNNLSTINNAAILSPSDEFEYFKDKLLNPMNSISQLDLYIKGKKMLPCPVYTIFGPLDDPNIIHKFKTGEYNIPNLYLIDHLNNYEIVTPLDTQPNIRLYGLGGSLKIHSLFDNGNINYDTISGRVGDLWITLVQIAEFYQEIMKENTRETINIFISHAPVIKTPLLEHLAIMTNADFTISQGLHFRYPVMGNGMSFVDSMGGSAGYIENYRSKFSRLRMILGELWLIIREDLMEILDLEDGNLRNSIELGLSLFDKIPVSINDSIDKIIPLTLSDEKEDLDAKKKILKKINDYYFQAYYNLWHFNLCDHISQKSDDYNIMIFKLNKQGNFNLDYCNSQGFNFDFKLQDDLEDEEAAYDVSFSEDNKERNKYGSVENSPGARLKKQIIDEEDHAYNHSESSKNNYSESNELNYEDDLNEYNEDENDEYFKSKHTGSSRGLYRGIRGRGRGSSRSRGSYRGRVRGRGRV